MMGPDFDLDGPDFLMGELTGPGDDDAAIVDEEGVMSRTCCGKAGILKGTLSEAVGPSEEAGGVSKTRCLA